MKISLTKIKYAAFASQETSCFEAVVLLDGVPSIHVRNDGHGGCNYEHDIVPGSSKRLQEYAASLQDRVVSMKEYGKEDFTVKCCSETLVGELLDDYLTRRDMKRALGKKAMCKFTDKPGIFEYKYKWMAHGTNEAFKKMVLTKHPGAIFLNELSEDEALKLWKESAN